MRKLNHGKHDNLTGKRWKRCLSGFLSGCMILSGIAVSPAATAQAAGESSSTVSWVMTQEGNYWQEQPSLTTTAWDANNVSDLYIDVDENITYQQMAEEVWGGCFNERGWKYLNELSETDRNHILDLLFDPNEEDGLHLTLARMPIGSSDYAIDMYSLDDVEDDYALEHFSIERDKDPNTGLIPYIKEALKRQPNLKIWASPWSPPYWMKIGGTADKKNGGLIEYTPENMACYGQYFRKFIEAYKAEGIDIFMVSPQNEPTMNTPYSSCVWTGEQLRDFIKDYLGPALEGTGVEIYLGTFTNSDDSRIDPVLADPASKKYVSGITFQWWSYLKANSLYNTGFDLGMMQSETMCGDGNNNWSYAENQFDLMWMYLESGITAYNLWNMVLEWDGVNPGGDNTAPSPWHQNAPITVNETTKEYTINPHYYEYKHFTNYIQPGARRISSTGTYDAEFPLFDAESDNSYTQELHEIAFRNPDGTNVLMVKNGSDETKHVDINFNGRKVSVDIPAHSINTFATTGTPLTGNETDMTKGIPAGEIVKIENKATGQMLCVAGAGGVVNSGTQIIQWDNNGEASQQWYLEPSELDGMATVKLVNIKSGKIVAVNGGSTSAGGKMILWPYEGGKDQNWILEADEATGCYRFKNGNSGLYLSGNEGVQAEQQSFNASDEHQLWKLVNVAAEGLTDTIAYAEKLVAEGTGTQEYLAALNEALTAAKNVDSTNSEAVVQVKSALEKAIKGQVDDTPVATKADKTALAAAIQTASGKVQKDYTADSWAKLQTALTNAKKVNEDEAATQEQVNAAVSALNSAIQGLVKAPAVVVKPGTPSSVKASWTGKKKVKITWKKAANAEKYEVYRSYKKSSGFKKIATVKKVSYVDKKAAAGKNVYYKVIAVKGTTKGSYSKTVSTYVVKAPAKIKAKVNKNTVTISFGKVTKASGYEIYRAAKKNGKYKKVATLKSAKTVKKKFTKVKKGNYFFKVRAYKTVNGKKAYTGYSKIIKVTVKK